MKDRIAKGLEKDRIEEDCIEKGCIENPEQIMFSELDPTPTQWQDINSALSRSISSDNSILDPSPEEPLTSLTNSATSEMLGSAQNSMEDSSEHSETTPLQAVAEEPSPLARGSDSSYDKNICAYIIKKTVQCFIQATYRRKVEKLCRKYRCDYS
jgi:hypothetical protein